MTSSFGAFLENKRDERDWSRRKLAEEAGMNERYLLEIEKGRADPQLATKHILLSAIDADTDLFCPDHPLKAFRYEREWTGANVARQLNLNHAQYWSLERHLRSTMQRLGIAPQAVADYIAGDPTARVYDLTHNMQVGTIRDRKATPGSDFVENYLFEAPWPILAKYGEACYRDVSPGHACHEYGWDGSSWFLYISPDGWESYTA